MNDFEIELETVAENGNQPSKYLYPIMMAVTMALVFLLCPPVLYMNDDIVMRSILSGAYTGTPNGHAVYMQYPLTLVLSLLYRIIPIVPWLELFFTGCIFACMMLVMQKLPHYGGGTYLVLIFFLPFFVFMHYTIIAAVVGGTAVFLVCRSKRSWVSIILLWLSFMIRSQVGLLCLAFVAAGLVWRILRTEDNLKTDLKGIGKYAGILILGLVIISGFNAIFYCNAEWREYKAYNEARTALYDYTNFVSAEKYVENHDAYGMTEEEAQVLTKYYTMLDSSIDSERLQSIEEKVTAGMWENMGAFSILKNCLKKYWIQVVHCNLPYNYVWAGFYVVLFAAILVTGKWFELAFLAVLGAGRSVVWLYLIWQDRFPERVVLSLYIVELLLLLAMSVSVIKDLKAGILQNRVWLQKLCIIALAIVGGAVGGYVTAENYKNAYEHRKMQQEWDGVKAYCAEHPDNTYFMDMNSMANCFDARYSSKQTNMLAMGGWLTASPLVHQRMDTLGGQDAAEILYYNDGARLLADVGQDMSWLQEYMKNRFGDCELVAVNVIYSGFRGIIEYQVIQ